MKYLISSAVKFLNRSVLRGAVETHMLPQTHTHTHILLPAPYTQLQGAFKFDTATQYLTLTVQTAQRTVILGIKKGRRNE